MHDLDLAALAQQHPCLLFHSQRGRKYARGTFRNVLKEYGIISSLNRHGSLPIQYLRRDAIGLLESRAQVNAWELALYRGRAHHIDALAQQGVAMFDAGL